MNQQHVNSKDTKTKTIKNKIIIYDFYERKVYILLFVCKCKSSYIKVSDLAAIELNYKTYSVWRSLIQYTDQQLNSLLFKLREPYAYWVVRLIG